MIKTIDIAVGCLPELDGDPIGYDALHVVFRTWRNNSKSELEVFPLCASSCITGRCLNLLGRAIAEHPT